jgi:arsenate reductase
LPLNHLSPMLKIYHNTRCTKSRCALQALEQSGKTFEVIEYLKTPPAAAELSEILRQMGKRPQDIIRKKEPLFKEQFADKTFSDAEWLDILVAYPVLIERPIVVSDTRAWVAREDEALAEIVQ